MRMKPRIAGAAAAVVTALCLALPGGANAEFPQSGAPTGMASGLPDIIPTTLGFWVNGGGPTGWGGSTTIDNPAVVDAVQMGPQNNMCRFSFAAYRTHNKGDAAAGAFVNKVYRDGVLIHTQNVPGGLPAKSGIDWNKFRIDLKEGMNTIKVDFDANKQVAESDEQNAYSIRVNVKIDCDGDGSINGVGGFQAKPERPGPGGDPVRSRKLRVMPRS